MNSNDLYKRLKMLIFEAAASDNRVGPLEESLKWGQPSFTPLRKNIGSSVRLSTLQDGAVGMYFICTTGLVDRFKEIYPDFFDYRNGREIVFKQDDNFDVEALKHCIIMALTYKLIR